MFSKKTTLLKNIYEDIHMSYFAFNEHATSALNKINPIDEDYIIKFKEIFNNALIYLLIGYIISIIMFLFEIFITLLFNCYIYLNYF